MTKKLLLSEVEHYCEEQGFSSYIYSSKNNHGKYVSSYMIFKFNEIITSDDSLKLINEYGGELTIYNIQQITVDNTSNICTEFRVIYEDIDSTHSIVILVE